MIDPRAEHQSKLRALANAGSLGLPMERVGIGTAVMFAVLGFARPINRETDRVIATERGRAFAWRDAA